MARICIDKILGKPLKHQHKTDILASAPANPVDGQMYINSVDNKLYIYWGQWQVLHTLVPPTPSVTTRFASLWFLYGNIH